MEFVRRNDIEKVKSLLSGGVNIEFKAAMNLTPFLLACDVNHQEIALMLLEKGADIQAVSNVLPAPHCSSLLSLVE